MILEISHFSDVLRGCMPVSGEEYARCRGRFRDQSQHHHMVIPNVLM